MILVYQNEILINQFNGCGEKSQLLRSILFDQNDSMVTSCSINNIYLYSANGSFTGKSLSAPPQIMYIGFDSKGRFIQISKEQINIYN